jgi:hypothetical protein
LGRPRRWPLKEDDEIIEYNYQKMLNIIFFASSSPWERKSSLIESAKRERLMDRDTPSIKKRIGAGKR